MARAPYNIRYDVYSGSVPFPTVGLMVGFNIPGRLVLQDNITTLTPFPSLRTAWLTSNTGWTGFDAFFTSTSGGVFSRATAHFIAIPSGSPPTWYVVLVEEVTPVGRPPYRRMWLAPIPP